jgi:crossover junction endodeoxyribonuclease RuvC
VIILGIDPGITGAISHFIDGRLDEVIDMPVFDTRVNGRELDDIVAFTKPDCCYLEDTQPMPKNGSIASFKLGLNTGIVIGVIQAAGVSLIRVRPATWKRKMGLIGKPKDAVRGLVVELYPDIADGVRRVKDQGRADAIMIGRYGVYDQIHNQTGEDNNERRRVGDDAADPAEPADHSNQRPTPGA